MPFLLIIVALLLFLILLSLSPSARLWAGLACRVAAWMLLAIAGLAVLAGLAYGAWLAVDWGLTSGLALTWVAHNPAIGGGIIIAGCVIAVSAARIVDRRDERRIGNRS